MDLGHATRLLGATMRLTRLIVADDIPGQWWIKDPLRERAARAYADTGREPWWWRYTQGLDCPFCVGLWIAAAVTVADEAAGDSRAWRVFTTALALNEAAAHAGTRLGDTPPDPQENHDE